MASEAKDANTNTINGSLRFPVCGFVIPWTATNTPFKSKKAKPLAAATLRAPLGEARIIHAPTTSMTLAEMRRVSSMPPLR